MRSAVRSRSSRVFAVVEVSAGYAAGSLALLADAGHMLGDAGSLGLALFAAWLGSRPASPERSFGYRRAEILAALANGVALVAIAIWIVVEALQRLRDPVEPSGGWVFVVGLVGLALNLAAASLLHRRGSGSLNVQGALRHVLADALGSLGVIAAGAIVLLTGWSYADPLVALAIARARARQLLDAPARVGRDPARGRRRASSTPRRSAAR